MKARLQVRRTVYRRTSGWKVAGTDTFGRRVDIFAYTEDGARRIKEAIKVGDHDLVGDLLRNGL